MHPPPAPALLLALALAATLAPPPARARPPQDWEPVTPAELALAQSRIEPGAGAEAIFWKVWVTHELLFDGRLRQTHDHYVRLKVFTAEGAETYGTVDIDYPRRQVSVRDIRARTIQPDGSVVPMERRAILKAVVVRRKGEETRRQSFALPAVKPGSILEYRYREIRDGDPVIVYDLQKDLPVERLSYFVKPLDLRWNLRQMRFGTAATTSDAPLDGYYETTVTDQPAYREEPFSPPALQQRAWLLQYYTRETLTSPDVFWRDFARREADGYEGATRPTDETRTLAAQIVAGDTTVQGRLRRLGEWVQREFRVCDDDPDTLSARGLGETRTLRDLLRGRLGTHSDAMLVFGGLARALGLETRLLRVGSSAWLFFDQNMMDGVFLPRFEIGVREGRLWRAYDPATRALPWDMLPWDQEGELALLCVADSARFVQNPLAAPARSRLTTTGTLRLGEDGTVEGDVVLSFSGHLNEDIRPGLEDAVGGEVDSIPLQQTYWLGGGLQVSESRWVMGGGQRGPLELRRHIRLAGFAMRTGRRIILEPAVLRAHAESPFTASERRAPVWFRYAWSERDSLVLELPAGWKAEAIDAPEPFESDGIGYQSGCRVSDDGRSILYLRSHHVGDRSATYFPVERYPVVKQLFDRVRQGDRATITLVRADGR